MVRLKLGAPDGKQRETDYANTEILFRIIQSIPSPRAEPFRRWRAQVGYKRVKEIVSPELASARARELFQAKCYPTDWIRSACAPSAATGLVLASVSDDDCSQTDLTWLNPPQGICAYRYVA